MLDFHISPPSAFFGLIKSDEGLVVDFDLIAGPDHTFTEQQESKRKDYSPDWNVPGSK